MAKKKKESKAAAPAKKAKPSPAKPMAKSPAKPAPAKPAAKPVDVKPAANARKPMAVAPKLPLKPAAAKPAPIPVKPAPSKTIVSKSVSSLKERKQARDDREAREAKPIPVRYNTFTEEDNQQFRELLVRKRQQLMNDIEGMDDVLDHTDSSPSPMHLADLGSDVFEQDLTLNLVENNTEDVRQIDEALRRIDDRTYGICELCGCTIPKKRLMVITFAKYCVACTEEAERKGMFDRDRPSTFSPDGDEPEEEEE